jgi:hypothetical protein
VKTVTNRNLIQDGITRGLNSGNVCYQSVQNILSSRLAPKNLKIMIHKTIILPVVLYGCDIKAGTQTEDVREQGVGENIWTEEG